MDLVFRCRLQPSGVSEDSQTVQVTCIFVIKSSSLDNQGQKRSGSLWGHLSGLLPGSYLSSLHRHLGYQVVTDEQRELVSPELSGPQYLKFLSGQSDDERIKRIQHPNATMSRGLHHGWVLRDPSQIHSREGVDSVTGVQDPVIHKMWLSRAGEALKTAIPIVNISETMNCAR
jgi:hypothetical protein